MNRDLFFDRHRNLNIQRAELERKYRVLLREQEEARMMQQMILAKTTGGAGQNGPALVTTFEFVVNTLDSLYFTFDFTSTAEPITFTIDWGDGEVYEGSGVGGFYSENHTYAEVGDYTVKVEFDDPAKILELDFPGGGDAPIKSVSGLQLLTNLQVFRADFNALESIDFSGLANLVNVDISDCDFVGTSDASLSNVILSGCTNLEELRVDDSDFSGGFPDLTGLTSLRFIDADQCGITGSLDISSLPALEDFDFSGNVNLTELVISSSQPLGNGGQYIDASNCDLTQTSVDAILVALSENGYSGSEIDLSGGTNAVPGTDGLNAKTVLEGNGWIVDVNS